MIIADLAFALIYVGPWCAEACINPQRKAGGYAALGCMIAATVWMGAL